MVSFSYLCFLRERAMRVRARKRRARAWACEEIYLSQRPPNLRSNFFESHAVNNLACGLVYSRQNGGSVDGFGKVSARIAHKERQWHLKRNVYLLWFLWFTINKRRTVIQSGAKLSSRDFSRAFFTDVFSVLWLQRSVTNWNWLDQVNLSKFL